MIKIIHTADIHLGKNFGKSLGEKGKEYRIQLLKSLENIVDLAINENASLLIIAGDLFDSNQVHDFLIRRVSSGFEKLHAKGIAVCILPGTHDLYNDESIYRFVNFPPNVSIFTEEHNKETYENLGLTVYGKAFDGKQIDKSPLQGLSVSNESKYKIGIAHCSVRIEGLVERDAMILDKNEIAGSGLDYLALGHWHSFRDLSQGNTKAFYCGSPEPISMNQKGSGNVAMVTIYEKGNIKVEPIPVGTKRFDQIEIDVGSVKSINDMINTIEAKSDPNLILQVTLSGLSNMNCIYSPKDIEEDLSKKFFYLRVLDRSHISPEEIRVEDFPEETVTGRFIRIMRQKIESASDEEEKWICEEALKLGFAILQGSTQVI